MLNDLPEVLSMDILSNWCDLHSVTKVDSAMCNQVDRCNFQLLLVDQTFCSTDSAYHASSSFWRWIVLHDVKLQHILWEEKTETPVAKVDCSKVTEFHVDLSEKISHVGKLINKSTHIKVLDSCASSACTSETLYALMSLISDQILSGLIEFILLRNGNYHHQHIQTLSHVATVCSQLHSLSVLGKGNGVSEDILIQIVRNGKRLQRLTLEGCVCETALMTAIGSNSAELQSLTIPNILIDVNFCSTESVCAMLVGCKQLTFCSLSERFRFSTTSGLLAVSIWDSELAPTFTQIFDMHHNELDTIELACIEESLLIQVSLKCPQLTELTIYQSWDNRSINTLRSIVNNCTKLYSLKLYHVDATYDEMVSIFCSDQVLALHTLDIWMIKWYSDLSIRIYNHNPSIVNCYTHLNDDDVEEMKEIEEEERM